MLEMQFLEFAFQGVRGCSPTVRAALRPGYLVLKQPGQDAVQLSSICSALLFADGRGGDAEYRAPGQAVNRAAITMQGNDQLIYRLIRNLGGSGALQKLNPANQQFELLSEDPSEIGQFLRSQVGLPAKKAFDELFSFTSRQLPTKRPRPRVAATSAPPSAKPLMGATPPVEAAKDIGAAEAKIAELEGELALSSEVERIQARADEVASTLFGIEERLKGSEALRKELRRAERAQSQAPTVEWNALFGRGALPRLPGHSVFRNRRLSGGPLRR